jgi:hypothetical protein
MLLDFSVSSDHRLWRRLTMKGVDAIGESPAPASQLPRDERDKANPKRALVIGF